jgi:hypothetical protein
LKEKKQRFRPRKMRLQPYRIRRDDYEKALYPQKLALISPKSGGRSVSIVRSRTKATNLLLLLVGSNCEVIWTVCRALRQSNLSTLSKVVSTLCTARTAKRAGMMWTGKHADGDFLICSSLRVHHAASVREGETGWKSARKWVSVSDYLSLHLRSPILSL